MGKFKQVGPASAPKPQPAPEAPPITKHEMIAKVWKDYKDSSLGAIEGFKKSVEEDGPSYAIVWKGESAMFAEAFLSETRGMEAYIDQKEPTEAADLLRIRDCFENLMASAATDLLGRSEYASSDGPWVAKSTSQLANIETVQKANVKRRLVSMYTRLLKCIDE